MTDEEVSKHPQDAYFPCERQIIRCTIMYFLRQTIDITVFTPLSVSAS